MPIVYNQIWCVSRSEVVPQYMTAHTWDNRLKYKKFQSVRKGGYNHEALISFDSLDGAIKELFTLKYPDLNPNRVESLTDYIEMDGEAVRYFSNYQKDGKGLSIATQEEYVTNVNVLKGIIRYSSERMQFIRARMGSTKAVEKQVRAEAIKLRDVIGHTLPKHDDRLRKTINEFKVSGYQSLISGHVGNSNSAKTKERERAAVLEKMISAHNNYNNAQITENYNHIAQAMGWESISDSTVAIIRKKTQLFTEGGRRGTKALMDNKLMQVKREAPSSAMLYWTLDGWDAELMYQKDSKNAKGENIKTYHNRLVIEVVLDPCTLYPIGYAIGMAENVQLIKTAIANALQHSKELFGQYYIPYQLQADNFAKKGMEKYYAVASQHFTPAKVGNAKAKVIEPYFNKLNRDYCQFEQNWSGHNVDAVKNNQPNREYSNAIKKEFPDMHGVIAQLVSIIEKERASKREAYLEAWGKTKIEHKKALTTEEYLLHFGVRNSDKTIKLSGAGLIPRINGERRFYDTFDMSFRTKGYMDWKVLYNPADLNFILAVSKDETLKYLLYAKEVQPMALADRKEGDGEKLQKIKDFNKNTVKAILDRTEENHNISTRILEQVSEVMPVEAETLKKMLMTDSKGQHKEHLKIASSAPPVKVTEEIEDYEFDIESMARDQY